MANLVVPAPTCLPEDQTTISNSKPSSLCEECGSNTWKYRCPGCAIKSCSLSCVNSHKARTSCTGKRNRTEFVPLSKFDDNLLLSDYNLLEETKRATESAHRLASSINGFGYFGFKLPKPISMLRNAAYKRRIKLLLLHSAMSKRKLNRSRYDYKKGSIFWTVEWKFHATDISLVDHFVDENTSLVSVIEKHLAPTPLRDQLTPFRNLSIDELKIFIRKTPKGPKSPFRELDINGSLNEQLSDVVILEYPVISVFLPSHSIDFEVEKYSKPAFRKPEVPTIDTQLSPKGKLFEEEEIEEGEIPPDTVATDPMAPTNIQVNNEAENDTVILNEVGECSRPSNDASVHLVLGDINFDFQGELIDAYSEILGGLNPDDFLCFDDDYGELCNMGDIFVGDELEEGEILDI